MRQIESKGLRVWEEGRESDRDRKRQGGRDGGGEMGRGVEG